MRELYSALCNGLLAVEQYDTVQYNDTHLQLKTLERQQHVGAARQNVTKLFALRMSVPTPEARRKQ